MKIRFSGSQRLRVSEEWDLHFILLPGGKEEQGKKKIQENDQGLANKTGKFPTPNYTLTNLSGQMTNGKVL